MAEQPELRVSPIQTIRNSEQGTVRVVLREDFFIFNCVTSNNNEITVGVELSGRTIR